MGKIVNIIFIIAGAAAVIAAIDYFSPVKISGLISDTLFKGGGCTQVVTIDTKDMEPRLRQNSTVVFNTCIADKSRIPNGSVILIAPFLGEKKIRIIKVRNPRGSSVYYDVATDKNPFDLENLNSSDITGVLQEQNKDTPPSF